MPNENSINICEPPGTRASMINYVMAFRGGFEYDELYPQWSNLNSSFWLIFILHLSPRVRLRIINPIFSVTL